MSKKRASGEEETTNGGYRESITSTTDEPLKKKSNAGRPKGVPKLDPAFSKKFGELLVCIQTVVDLLGDDATPSKIKIALKKQIGEFGDVGEGIHQFLLEESARNDASVAEKEHAFNDKLKEYKSANQYGVEEDKYISSIRKGDLARLEEHQKFLEVCGLAVVFYKELYVTDKSEKATNNKLIEEAMQEMKEDARKEVRNIGRFASIASQDAGDGVGDDGVDT